MSYDCDHRPPCVNQRHHTARFYTEREPVTFFKEPYGRFVMTPEEKRYFDLGAEHYRTKRGLWWRLVDWWKAG